MSYTRPPFDAAEASWSGAAVYVRPVPADATFMADAPRVEMVGAATIPASIPVITAVSGTVESVFGTTGQATAQAPAPSILSISGAIHAFVPYVDPGLDLTLDCRVYLPRPLDCAVALESTWQPPCLQVVVLAGYVSAAAPTPTVTVVSGSVVQVLAATGQATVPAPTPTIIAAGTVQQNLDLAENGVNGARAVYARRARATANRIADRPAQARATQTRAYAPQHQGVPLQAGSALPQTQMLPLRLAAMLEQQQGIRVSGFTGLPHTETLRHRESIGLPQTETLRTRAWIATPHAETLRTRTRRRIEQRQAVAVSTLLQTIDQQARPTQTRGQSRWQQMMWPLPGYWWGCYWPPPLKLVLYCDPDYAPRPLRCLTVLCLCDGSPQPPCLPDPGGGPIIIPIRRVYRVLNTVTLVRLADSHPIDATRLSLSLSADAWTWSWSATLPATMLGLIQSGAAREELLVTLNGESIRLRIDSISRSRSFGSASLSVSGRGFAAWLASPRSPIIDRHNAEASTALALLIQALTENEASIGWAVDWGLENWPVPAGAWSHSGTYMEAAIRIAEAGGGYVQGHDTDQTLIVRPYYPIAPWDWADLAEDDLDILMPEDVCKTEGIEWKDKTAYNSVWITGNVGGRRDFIRRAGSDTSGQPIAPTVVDDLATDVIMTRQRGIRVLGDAGRQAWVTVALPVVEETGLIRPGQMIQYSEQGTVHRGLSRALSVEYQFPSLWQTIQLETHPT